MNAPAPVLPPADKTENELAIRVDGLRFKIQNLRHEPVIVRKLEREGYEPVIFGMVIPSMGTLDLPARDARGAKLTIEVARCLDVLAPRKFATVRHAGELVERRGFVEELHLTQLPLVPNLFSAAASWSRDEGAAEESSEEPVDEKE
jgi:hypothetical protein